MFTLEGKMRKFFLALAVAAMATSAYAADTSGTITINGTNTNTGKSNIAPAVPACVEQFKTVPALAKRLHVKEGLGAGGFSIRMCDGRTYDLLALLGALLDRMDKMERHILMLWKKIYWS